MDGGETQLFLLLLPFVLDLAGNGIRQFSYKKEYFGLASTAQIIV